MDDRPERRPSADVKVGLPHQYVSFATELYGWDHDVREWWTDLGDLLGGRQGWYCELANTSDGLVLLWSFGAMGTSLFNIGPPTTEDDYSERRYHLYDFDADEDLHFAGTGELLIWLEDNEARHDLHVRNALRPMAEAENWSFFKRYVWDVEVSYAEDHWIARVPKLPGEVAIRPNLVDALADVREVIAQVFGSPTSVANELRLSPRLDWTATAALGLPTR